MDSGDKPSFGFSSHTFAKEIEIFAKSSKTKALPGQPYSLAIYMYVFGEFGRYYVYFHHFSLSSIQMRSIDFIPCLDNTHSGA